MKITAKTVIIISAVIALGLAGFGAYEIFLMKENFVFSYAAAEKGEVKEEIRTDGAVKAADEVELAFERSGKIGSAPFKIGDKVRAGDVLASLTNSDTAAQLAQARAGVASAQAQYASAQAGYELQQSLLSGLQSGATPQNIAVSQTAADNAGKSLNDAQTNLNNVKAKADSDMASLLIKTKDALNDAYAKTFDAVNAKTAGMFSDSQTDPQLTFFINNDALTRRIESEREQANATLPQMKNRIDNLELVQDDAEKAVGQAITDLEDIRNLFTDLGEGLNYTVSSANFTDATISADKANVNTALTNINTAIASLQGQDQAVIAQAATNQNLVTAAESLLTQAQNGVDLAAKQLAAVQAGPTGSQIQAQQQAVAQAQSVASAQEAAVAAAQASVMNFQAQYDKTMIKAPFDGVITRQDAKVGEIAPPNAAVIGLISQARFKVETMMPEDDIARIEIGQEATVTLDSYGSDTPFTAKVVSIDPGAELVNGEPTYKTTLQFDDESDLIKAGLTANIDIVVGAGADALTVPKTAVIAGDYQSYVMAKSAALRPELKPVVTGLEGEDKIQITSGLEAGDEVVTFGGNIKH